MEFAEQILGSDADFFMGMFADEFLILETDSVHIHTTPSQLFDLTVYTLFNN